MGPAYGAGVRSKAEAVVLIAVFSTLGALIAGDKVVKTIATDILGGPVLNGNVLAVVIILLASTAVVAAGNVLPVPLATAHAMVGAVVGVGIYLGSVNWQKTALILAWWLATPLAALVLSFLISRYAYEGLKRRFDESGLASKHSWLYRLLITGSGCYLAFSAGSNGLAKAVGPLVAARVMNLKEAALLGAAGMAVGAIVIGPRLLETVGKEIIRLDPLKAALVEVLGGTIVLAASLAGIPVSLAEIITCCVIGFSCGLSGIRFTSQIQHVRVMSRLWPLSPVLSGLTAFVVAALVSPVRVFLAGL